MRPEKVWLFDLSTDPTEKNNLAPTVGVTSQASLHALIEGRATNKSVSDQSVTTHLIALYQTLQQVNAEQREPLWPSLTETPILLDKVQGDQEILGDEYIYWCN